MAEGKLLFRPAEAADSLGVSRARLYQLIAAGEIDSVKVGASRRIPAADLDAFVQRLRSERTRDGAARQATASARVAA